MFDVFGASDHEQAIGLAEDVIGAGDIVNEFFKDAFSLLGDGGNESFNGDHIDAILVAKVERS